MIYDSHQLANILRIRPLTELRCVVLCIEILKSGKPGYLFNLFQLVEAVVNTGETRNVELSLLFPKGTSQRSMRAFSSFSVQKTEIRSNIRSSTFQENLPQLAGRNVP